MNSVNSPNLGLETKSLDPLLAGKSYRAVAGLGRGGMGELFVVVHTVLKRRFALKVIQSHYARFPHFVDRMRIEAQAAARLQHPHIVEVVDFWLAADGRPCMVMELLEGGTVAQEVALRGVLPVSDAIEFTLQLFLPHRFSSRTTSVRTQYSRLVTGQVFASSPQRSHQPEGAS